MTAKTPSRRDTSDKTLRQRVEEDEELKLGSPRDRAMVAAYAQRYEEFKTAKFKKDDQGRLVPKFPKGGGLVWWARLSQATGSSDTDLSDRLICQAGGAAEGDDQVKNTNAAAAILAGIAPQNETEAMLAVAMIGAHNLAMYATRRAIGCEYPQNANAFGNIATKAGNLFVRQIEALAKLRGKTPVQTVRVERVTVEAGGQAVVGAITNPSPGGVHAEKN